MFYQLVSWIAFALSILCTIGLIVTMLMLTVEQFEWTRIFSAGLLGMGAVVAWLVSAELAGDRSHDM